MDTLLPVLYLRGISTGDFQEALAALLGQNAPNLSPAVISRRPSGRASTSAGRSAICRREIGDLVQRTEAEMLSKAFRPEVPLSEISEALTELGLHLGMEIAGWPIPRARKNSL